jgi:NTE family protein
MPSPSPSSPHPVPVTLALQGGGALGAFTWGVLDRLLDAPELRIEAVSGTSAGAMNGAMLVQGLAAGGPGEAKRLLERLWRDIAAGSGALGTEGAGDDDGSSGSGGMGDWLQSAFNVAGAALPMMADMARQTAQGLFGGAGGHVAGSVLGRLNPLRGVLEGLVDPAAFGRPGVPALVVAATRVRTGEARLFRDEEVTVDAVLASCCLPQLFPAVEIDGEAYWDGGFSANPPLRALIEAGCPADVVVVRTTPQERPEPPADPVAVYERVSELAFDASLRQELRSIAVAQRLLADLPPDAAADLSPGGPLARLREARLHAIGAEREFRALPRGSYLDTSWGFLRRLHGLRRRRRALARGQPRLRRAAVHPRPRRARVGRTRAPSR